MRINGKPYRTIWLAEDGWSVEIIDQTRLPHDFAIARLTTLEEAAHAIRAMLVRGAPLIGATAAYGMALALRGDPNDIGHAYDVLLATRPTAINLRWALDRMRRHLIGLQPEERAAVAYAESASLCDEDVAINEAIGSHGADLIRQVARSRPGKPVNILTHCNAGWLATVDWGTALAPVYKAFEDGVPLHVWVDETRPRNQGMLTAGELAQHGVPHTVIADNAGGHLMQQGKVDLCIVGTDRTTRNGDVRNKIGTYLKALAAHDNRVPFYAAVPSPSIDWTLHDGLPEIQIKKRAPREVTHFTGQMENGTIASIALVPQGSPAANPAFD